ncbi:MAG TPA: Na+/H+ antiporter NhaA, partial [Burkholderiales bacterium]|nr:Na+/H+ antiporter NhaA [Burkholderiales bacterium]
MHNFKPFRALREFLALEAAGGILLAAAAALAMLLANSPLASLYGAFLDTRIEVRVGTLEIAKPLLLWVNDGLM